MDALTQKVLSSLFVELEASARHVHLTKAQAQTLFGHGLTESRPLSQPGQYLARERVTVVGPKGKLERVAVLGPIRPAGQVELSVTDARLLGIEVPIRLSGDIGGTPGCTLLGPEGEISLPQGVIVAQRHIHLRPEDAAVFGVKDRQVVSLRTYTRRPVVFREVVVRVSGEFAPYAHLDFDEANACGFLPGDLGRIVP